MTYGMSRTLDLSFADAVEQVRQALQEQGFGVLTEIDVTATLKSKLGEDIARVESAGASAVLNSFQGDDHSTSSRGGSGH